MTPAPVRAPETRPLEPTTVREPVAVGDLLADLISLNIKNIGVLIALFENHQQQINKLRRSVFYLCVAVIGSLIVGLLR